MQFLQDSLDPIWGFPQYHGYLLLIRKVIQYKRVVSFLCKYVHFMGHFALKVPQITIVSCTVAV